MQSLAKTETYKLIKKAKETFTEDQKMLRQSFFYVLFPTVISSEREYDKYMKVLADLMDVYKTLDKKAKKDAKDYLNALGNSIEEYEKKHYPIDVDDVPPHEYLKWLIEMRNYKRKDLIGPIFNSESALSRACSGQRKITIEQAKKLASFFNVDVKDFL